jgi:hypothetical protein
MTTSTTITSEKDVAAEPDASLDRLYATLAAAAALLVTAILAAAVFTPHAIGAGPSLRVSATPATTAPGGSVQVQYAVKSLPAALALRLDDHQLKKVRVRTARGRTSVALPTDIAPGPHQLTACVKRACRSLTVTVVPQGPPSTPPATPAPQPEPRPETPVDVDFTGPANPLDVQAHTDASRTATETIDTAGGTLEVTGADGTHYKLIVPEGALLSPERISMAPISSVDGLPFSGGLAYGVQLEPSGLRFIDHVTLEVTGHPPVPADRETGFLYQQDGAEFQMYPIKESPSKTTFKIMHFSGVGVASGTESERNAQLLRATRDVEGRFAQQLATYFRPGEPIDYPGVQATLRAYHDQILKPLVTAAVTDDGLAMAAIPRYLNWARMVALLFGDDDEFMLAERQTLRDQWLDVITNAAQRAYQRCLDENRPEELPAILSWWRMVKLIDDEEVLPADAISRCARFELDFHTKIVQKHAFNLEGPEVWKGEAIAENVIIKPDPVTLEQHGGKDAQYVDFRVEIPPHPRGTGCWTGGDEWESTFPFTVSRLMIDLNPIQLPDGTYGIPEFERGKIALSVVPFFVREHQYFVDCGESTGSGGWGSWLAPTFLALHEDQLDEFGGMVFTDWTVPTGGGSMLGAKTYFRTVTVDEHETREETTLELYHAPTP